MSYLTSVAEFRQVLCRCPLKHSSFPSSYHRNTDRERFAQLKGKLLGAGDGGKEMKSIAALLHRSKHEIITHNQNKINFTVG